MLFTQNSGRPLLLRKRLVMESVIDQLKNISQIEHSWHRSVKNFIVNVLAGLIAYSLREEAFFEH